MREYKRTVGERGQITIPKDVRDRLGITGGDEILVIETDAGVFINRSVTDKQLAEGYRIRATRSRELEAELTPASTEATQNLGDAPDWEPG